MASNNRRRTLGLKTHHFRLPNRLTRLVVFRVALPVSRNIAGITHGQEVVVRRVAQNIDNLKCRRFLPFDAIWIQRIDQRYGMFLSDTADNIKRLIEITVDSHDCGTVHYCLRQLAQRDITFRYHDDTIKSAVGRESRPLYAG